ncbi:hypothetical protein [Pseudarthrobacter sp. N5]|uniref:hypothetical protein n=1 Tax=Pseudarthrobacter sp. N5 TaxID=3418416 RepID=UPI003CE6A234
MSQEQPPVRSRRELRQTRDENLEQNQAAGTAGPGRVSPAVKQAAAAAGPAKEPGQPATTGRIRRVAPGPVDSVPATSASERTSQIRARDRAALQTIKELAEKEEQLSAGGPPTRRQLRLQQLQEQAVTSANPVVPVPRTAAEAASAAPYGAPEAPKKSGQQAAAMAVPTAGGARESEPGDQLPHGMTVEQALVTRSLIAEQAKNQLATMEHIASQDPEAVDPDVLAEQIALAERAAILNRRALAKQKLAEQNSQSPKPRQDPSAASNLAMVTPLEFVQMPGVDRPVMKPPVTSYVPVLTNSGPRLQRPSAAGPHSSPAARLAARGPSTGRSRVLARAEAAAKAASGAEPAQGSTAAGAGPDAQWATETGENFAERPRVAANSAHGLEPLDVVTAGLGRAQRVRLLQLAVLAVGIVALIAGVTMIISGLTR